MAENNRSLDIKDSEKDIKKLKADKATIDLPDVGDIPGQEHIHVPSMGELGDTTISSADEEGEGVFGDDEEGGRGFTMNRKAEAEDRDGL